MGDRVEEVCRAHRDFCARREKEVRKVFCGGQTVENMPHKCKGCPYASDWSCLVKFALEYEKGKGKGEAKMVIKEGDKVKSNGKYPDIQSKFGDTVHTVVAVGTIPSCKKPMVWLDCGGGGFMADGFSVIKV